MSISKLQNLDLLGIIGSYANAQELGRMACTNKRLKYFNATLKERAALSSQPRTDSGFRTRLT